MKTLKFLVLLQLGFFSESKRSLVPQAILQLVQSQFGDSSAKIEVFYNSNRMKILDETLKLLSEVRELKITKVNTALESCCFDTHYAYSIFLFDTIKNFCKFYFEFKNQEQKIWTSDIKFLVHIEISEKREIQTIIAYRNDQNYLIVENGEITLHSITMITERKCGERQLTETNRFSVSEGKWMTDKFLAPIIENFFGCELVIKLGHNQLPFLKWEVSEDGKIIVEGVLVRMIEELSVHLNFKTKFVTGNVHYHLMLDAASIDVNGFSVTAFSGTIFSTSDVFIMPPGASYTPWEQLLLPFDEATWMWLGITFTIAYLVILLIRLSKSRSMYDFVIGSNVSTPSLNIVGIFMGVSQNIFPRRSVSRFLFTCFILFCLIMRTAYQGKYFEFITGGVRKKPITSMEELKEKNFNINIDQEKYFWQTKTLLDNYETYEGLGF